MKKIAFKMKEKDLTFEKWLTKALKILWCIQENIVILQREIKEKVTSNNLRLAYGFGVLLIRTSFGVHSVLIRSLFDFDFISQV